MRVYMTRDSPDVYEDSFMATAQSGDGMFKPTVILISTRLGIDKITQVYWEALISALQMPQSVGIAGYENTCQDKRIRTSANHDEQWSPLVVSLFRRLTRELLVLSRPTPYKDSAAV